MYQALQPIRVGLLEWDKRLKTICSEGLWLEKNHFESKLENAGMGMHSRSHGWPLLVMGQVESLDSPE